jgi:hypothetical protein
MIQGPDKIVQELMKAYVAGPLMTDNALWTKIFDGQPAGAEVPYRNDFRANPPTVKLGFARQNDPWPLWAVVLTGDNTGEEFVGKNERVILSESDIDTDELTYSMLSEQEVSIIVYSENPDVTRVQSQIACGIILASLRDIVAAGVDSYSYIGMQDLAPQSNYLPETLWARVQTWKFLMNWTMPAARDRQVVYPPAYVGLDGVDLGNGHVGKVDPTLNH